MTHSLTIDSFTHSLTHSLAHSNSREQRVEEANRNLLEEENEFRLQELGQSVSMLKAMSLDINNEVKSQNRLLDSMGGVSLTDLLTY